MTKLQVSTLMSRDHGLNARGTLNPTQRRADRDRAAGPNPNTGHSPPSPATPRSAKDDPPSTAAHHAPAPQEPLLQVIWSSRPPRRAYEYRRAFRARGANPRR